MLCCSFTNEDIYNCNCILIHSSGVRGLTSSSYSYDSFHISPYTYLENSEIDEKQHKLNHEALVQISDQSKHPLLIDSIELVTLTPEARKYIRSLESKAPILARAVVTDSLANKILIRFYNNVHKPLYRIKVFSNYKEAQEWLLSL